MAEFQIVHTTEYRFPDAAWNLRLNAHLRPLDDDLQRCTYFQLMSRPPAEQAETTTDPFGNPIHRLHIKERLHRLTISAFSKVTVNAVPCSHDHFRQPIAVDGFTRPTELTPINSTIKKWGLSVCGPVVEPHKIAQQLCFHIHSQFEFKSGATDARTHAGQVLTEGRGVCQDFAHLAIAGLRSLGVAARYVSGYLHTAAFRGRSHRLAEDVSHAWIEVFDPSTGWSGFDPTHGRRTDHNYIVLARGRDYQDINPLEGSFHGGGAHKLHVAVDVQRIA